MGWLEQSLKIKRQYAFKMATSITYYYKEDVKCWAQNWCHICIYILNIYHSHFKKQSLWDELSPDSSEYSVSYFFEYIYIYISKLHKRLNVAVWENTLDSISSNSAIMSNPHISSTLFSNTPKLGMQRGLLKDTLFIKFK